MKLFKVTLRGMLNANIGVAYGISYVVAEEPTIAYKQLRIFLDTNAIGSEKDRELKTIELIADEYLYNNCGHLLLITPESSNLIG